MYEDDGLDWPPNDSGTSNNTFIQQYRTSNDLESWLADRFRSYGGLTLTERQIAKCVVDDAKKYPGAFLNLLVGSGLLKGIDNQLDHNGEVHTSYWIPEPIKHEHDWRWNINKNGTSDLFCVVEGCKDPFRNFKDSWGPKFPPKELWPRYKGPVLE